MPQYNVIKDLQELALDVVGNLFLDVVSNTRNDLTDGHKYFIRKLHASARTDVLNYTKKKLDDEKLKDDQLTKYTDPHGFHRLDMLKKKTDFQKWIAILRLLLDTGVKMLPCMRFYDLMDDEIDELIFILNNNSENLTNISVEFLHLNSLGRYKHSLEDNLASKLCRLQIQTICNNEVLKVIGANALCLKHLDVSRSHFVDDNGIRNLLLKDVTSLITDNKSDDEICQTLNKFYNDKEKLNACCFTLEHLNVSKTQIDTISSLMIPACIKTLKSVDTDDCTDENINDAFVTVWRNSPTPKRIFELTDMVEYKLNVVMISAYEECLPYIKNVTSTFLSLVTPRDFEDADEKSLFWDRVETLILKPYTTINYQRFSEFFSLYGHNLLKLVIEDTDCIIDVAKLLENCQNLELLNGPLRVSNTPVGQFKKLKTIFLFSPNMKTCKWFFENCPCLEEAKIENDGQLNLEDYIIKNPPLHVRNHLQRLEISYLCQFLNLKSITEFIEKCSKLQMLGSINTWKVYDDTYLIKQINEYARKKNYDFIAY